MKLDILKELKKEAVVHVNNSEKVTVLSEEELQSVVGGREIALTTSCYCYKQVAL